MPQIMMEAITNPVETRNIDASTVITCTSFFAFGLSLLMITIVTTMNQNVRDILSRKGKSGKAPFVQ